VRGFTVLAVLLALAALLAETWPLLETAGSSIPYAGWLVAALTGVLALGGAWYARRRWLRRRRDVRHVRERAEQWCLERRPLIRSGSVDREWPA